VGSTVASTIATNAQPEGSAMTFAQKAAMKPGKDGLTHEGIKCTRILNNNLFLLKQCCNLTKFHREHL
jgi:hypothetical protein